jgi:sulfate transport system substrate-binding protein
VIDGLEAHESVALEYDIDTIAERSGVIAKTGDRLPTITPIPPPCVSGTQRQSKNIRTGRFGGPASLLRPQSKTSGGAQWNYLAGWAFAANKFRRAKEDPRIHDSALPERAGS